jgi:hypothetical protein
VTHYGSTCGFIIEAFGLARDCLAVDPYSGVMVYDFASTPMSTARAAGQRNADGTYDVPVCNDLPSSIVSYKRLTPASGGDRAEQEMVSF